MINFKLSQEFLERFEKATTLVVGFSGGLDSTVLLHLLASFPCLKNKITAVYINHQLSPLSNQWAAHCQAVCQALDVNYRTYTARFSPSANIEARARNARYAIFDELLQFNDCLILAHHQNDQAETVLLQLFRGAGMHGLAAMRSEKKLNKGLLCRPLLNFSRMNLASYAEEHRLKWIEDESNQDCNYSRNFVRHQLLPLIKQRWPGVEKNLVRTAQHCQQGEDLLEKIVLFDCPELNNPTRQLSILSLKKLAPPEMAYCLRYWIRKNNLVLPSAKVIDHIIREVVGARMDAEPCVSWENNQIRRYQNSLYLLGKKTKIVTTLPWGSFPYPLTMSQLDCQLEAKTAITGLKVNSEDRVEVRFRVPGEKFYWHGQHKTLKKLWQQWKVPAWLRDEIPLIYVNDSLAMIVGYAISDNHYTNDGTNGYSIASVPISIQAD